MDINWYPGHMAKTKRLLKEALSLIDVIIELADARIPFSSMNPDLASIAAQKPRIVALNKSDLADPAVNKLWSEYFSQSGKPCILADSVKGAGFAAIIKAANAAVSDKKKRQASRGRTGAPVRAMVAGIPNVGKSTFINKLTGRAAQKTEDRPGVTRQNKWIKADGILLLDTPGILWPNLGDPAVGIKLAATGAIKDEILDTYTLCLRLIELITAAKPQALARRYKIEADAAAPSDITLINIARARGFIKKGGGPDTERAAAIVTDEFRAGKIGRISLETPDITECP